MGAQVIALCPRNEGAAWAELEEVQRRFAAVCASCHEAAEARWRLGLMCLAEREFYEARPEVRAMLDPEAEPAA